MSARRVADRRDLVLDYVREHPGQSAKQIADRIHERLGVVDIDLHWLADRGLLRAEKIPAGQKHRNFWHPTETPVTDEGRIDVEAYKRAAIWRDGFVSRVRHALELVDDAIAGAPISIERVQAVEARAKLARALATSEGDLAVAQQIVAEAEGESDRG